ncbi:MAG: CapA family protein, partial [Clostridia bacterium]|nr:CapA family protein [Clostridia bacterium]
YDRICEYMEENEYSDQMWESLCGYSIKALYDIVNGITDEYNYTVKEDSYADGGTGSTVTIAFAGDISLANNTNDVPINNWSPLIVHKNNRSNLLETAFSAELAQKMLSADIFAVNLENTFSSSEATPIIKKYDKNWYYVHRASPEEVEVLGRLGVDMVNIANDHIYDYSAKGLEDTLLTLKNAGITYIGGGDNLQDAKTPRYLIASGQKIAFVSAAQLKTKTMAPEAAAKKPGIVYATESTLYPAIISEAKENSDFVIAYIDWANVEGNKPDEIQKALARSFIDAGADLVIGTRAKSMQSIEYYNGKPIVYGLGNFWHETNPHNNLLLEIKFNKNVITQTASTQDSHYDETKTRYSIEKTPDIYCFPLIQNKAITTMVSGTEQGNNIINNLIQLSDGKISISEEGLLTEMTQTDAEQSTAE